MSFWGKFDQRWDNAGEWLERFWDKISGKEKERSELQKQPCTREMMPQGVQQWEIEHYRTSGYPQGIDPTQIIGTPEFMEAQADARIKLQVPQRECYNELGLLWEMNKIDRALRKRVEEERLLKERKEKLKNPKSIYLRKKK